MITTPPLKPLIPNTHNQDLLTLAKNLRIIRAGKGSTIHKTALQTGIPARLICKLERGETENFELGILMILRKFYEVSFEDLFEGM